MSNTWLVLAATLPTRPSAVRVRVWRALKASGAGTLRDGVYLLPAAVRAADELRLLAPLIRSQGGTAHLLEVPVGDPAQEQAFRALVDRSAAHAELQQAIAQAVAELAGAGEAPARRRLRQLSRQADELRAIDFFPGLPGARTEAALAAWRQDMDRRYSPGEPARADAHALMPLDRADYQGRLWATRRRPWVDRLATAWLIRRHVDPAARFVWLAAVADCPPQALGFDFDGAAFTHVGDRVSFEVVAERFGLASLPGIAGLADIVHGLDVGGPLPDEAPGVELLLRGLRERHADDDALLAAALPLFDTLHAALANPA